MISIYKLADWFLNKESMPHKKLQKLCYYSVAWYYALYDSDLVNDTEFQAWIHGPVSPDLYSEYRKYGWNPIEKADVKPQFTKETEEFLEIVYNTYGDYSGHELEALTHGELPWIEARTGLSEFEPSTNPISKETMKNYYLSIYNGSQND
ncbi:Panacea domain-containing protein [Methanococcus maripaludis]|uniref:Antitoxin SocA-like Panacea domain-containing protein n=1 Tax=Methanococcus maripaludis OS7 TaxID=637915 RepID=A0A2Z5PG03_METMI|nr:type II toxin-antitoxin system antitoxin SocA domain-containing protein [Methanococcus maripaludis]BAP62922.1 hypothetical protein MMOS7_08360 [Methanococcus maripaludis OS7]